ncbi:UNVERIFIED_CONTAM: hypothetical protein HDU68_000148 [Siphonaria sp. JEL0065]|nr:hypothetical protein HDU68_000148 [Siphonaria sp. JEL0065]
MRSATILLLAATMVSAHFEMLSPIPRNVGDMMGPNSQSIFPCAGPNKAPVSRVNWTSLKDSSIVLTFYWDGSNDIYLGFGENPQAFPYKIGALANAQSGQTYTVPLDLSSVPANLLTQDAKFTVQVVCHQPKEDIYQCADFTNDVAVGPVTSQVPLPTTTTTTTNVQPEQPTTTVDQTPPNTDQQKTDPTGTSVVAAASSTTSAAASKSTSAAAASSTTSAKASDATTAIGSVISALFAAIFF